MHGHGLETGTSVAGGRWVYNQQYDHNISAVTDHHQDKIWPLTASPVGRSAGFTRLNSSHTRQVRGRPA